MQNRTDKTIPFILSPSELENLRILRQRTRPSFSDQDDEEDQKLTAEIEDLLSKPDQESKKTN